MTTSSHIPPITEDDIANYLGNNPDFFERHAQVLATVQMTSPQGSGMYVTYTLAKIHSALTKAAAERKKELSA